ncbi:TetR/AcrR family transcriptional regulator [Natronoglycomyces albus]|uniref:TetR/AcrR family transcriptional regulator C-terminal domain-containing protein n=1 Tax=Natronoglycomyces albus TaxID=2811108 RepID=A0A895XNS8_9ACTN|nr:TetR/AcrR family transcriptional regulator [Natronoglycomyces albus]QSB06787.1 TetR/AcrR family transcriptional regulator C-terminal domain-containing protein [Natronoglycomyces albus]
MAGYHTGAGNPQRSLELMWTPPNETSKPGPKPKLTLTAIVNAAIDIADTEGLAALSMRSVADKLGAGTMSLYRYVPGKGELLDLMVETLNAIDDEAEATYRNSHWRQAAEHMADKAWETYRAHPWMLEINQARPVFGPKMLRGFEATLASYANLNITDKEKIAILLTIDNFINGCARTAMAAAQQHPDDLQASDEEYWQAQMPYLERAMETGEYPHMKALDEDVWDDNAPGHPHPLHFGLSALLDGLEARIAELEKANRATDRHT